MVAFDEAVLERPKTAAVHLDAEMTINRVLHHFPAIAPRVKELHIHLPEEGCQCLDEVAWEHGMKTEEFLKVLENCIAECECRKKADKVPCAPLWE